MTTPDGVQNVYIYDDAGNRLTKTSTVDGISAVTEYTYDEQNRLLQTKAYIVGDTTKVYTYFGYDNNGNQIAKWTQTIGTPSENLYNIITVDTHDKLIKIIRIGSNLDRYLRKKDTLCINYKTFEVI